MQPHPEEHALADRGRDFAANDDIGDSEASAGTKDAEGFAEDAGICRRRD
jgi:hypothetical protein